MAGLSVANTLTRQFTAAGTFTDTTSQDVTTSVAWTSSDTAVATVDESGLATAVGEGLTTISAVSAGVSASASLTVTRPPAALVPGLTHWALIATAGGMITILLWRNRRTAGHRRVSTE